MKFLRQQAHYKKRIPLNWRKPKGHHSKLREKRRGLHKMPGIGYKSSKPIKQVVVHNLNELSNYKKGDKVFISSSVGNKKKLLMLEFAVKKGIIIKNYGKKISDKIKQIKDEFNNRLKKKIKSKPVNEVKEKVKKEVKTVKKKVVVKKSKKIKVKKSGDNK